MDIIQCFDLSVLSNTHPWIKQANIRPSSNLTKKNCGLCLKTGSVPENQQIEMNSTNSEEKNSHIYNHTYFRILLMAIFQPTGLFLYACTHIHLDDFWLSLIIRSLIIILCYDSSQVIVFLLTIVLSLLKDTNIVFRVEWYISWRFIWV